MLISIPRSAFEQWKHANNNIHKNSPESKKY
jgi:hypothetical protein